MTVDYRTGDVLDQIRQLPDASVDLVATSPPFLALRDYNGQEGQWGSEPDPASFLDHLLELTTELRRVLAPHGSIAIELGDTYSGSGGAGGDYADGGMRDGQSRFNGSAAKARAHATKERTRTPPGGWPGAKSLCGTPTLFAWSLAYGRNLARPRTQLEVVRWVERLRAGGISAESVAWLLSQTRFAAAPDFAPWLVRNVIVWARNNPPVGALGDKVRPATSYITVATPSPRRWFDLDAVRMPSVNPIGVGARPTQARVNGADVNDHRGTLGPYTPEMQANGAPPLDHWHDEPDGDLLWLINTQGSSLAHYAMWPPKLVERLILSMCPRLVCTGCGSGLPSSHDQTLRGMRTANRSTLGEVAEGAGQDQVLLGRLPESTHGQKPSEYQGLRDHHEGLQIRAEAGPPNGRSVGLRDGAPAGDRRAHRSDAGAMGSRAPSQRRQARQQAGEPGADDQDSTRPEAQAATRATRVPLVREPDLHGPQCPTCQGRSFRRGRVLDPFAGTGTTLAVADILGRDATGIDLDPANPGLYPARWEQCWKALRPDAGPAPITPAGQQLGLAI